MNEKLDQSNYLLPQKISFKLTGGFGGEYPIDLRATASFMLYFQHLLDKSYCVIANKDRISQSDTECYHVVVKDLQVGSVLSNLALIVEGARLSLPLLGFCNPKTIWDYACSGLDLAKKFFTDINNGIHPTITINGNNNTITYQNNNNNTVYPKEVFDIANKSIPVYKKMGAALKSGEFVNFSASSPGSTLSPIMLDQTSEELFKEKTIIDQSPISISCNIISFNKEKLTGRLRIVDDSCGMLNWELPFCVIGNQDTTQYINAMASDIVSLNILKEVTYSSLIPKVKRIQVIDIAA